ncbi:MAG: cytochrome d ubiquinol oxidase subunit II [Burkholderiales bacterium]
MEFGNEIGSALLLARAQFGLDIAFHILLPGIIIALARFLVYFRARHACSGDSTWLVTSKRRVKIFALTFAMGVDLAPTGSALAFLGLAYSLFPYVVMDRLTIWDAAAHPSSLEAVLTGALIVLPFIVGYTVFSYRVFRGKARAGLYE